MSSPRQSTLREWKTLWGPCLLQPERLYAIGEGVKYD